MRKTALILFSIVLAVLGGALGSHFILDFVRLLYGAGFRFVSLSPVDSMQFKLRVFFLCAAFSAAPPLALLIHGPRGRAVRLGWLYFGLELLCASLVALYYALEYRAVASDVDFLERGGIQIAGLPMSQVSLAPMLLSGPILVWTTAFVLWCASRRPQRDDQQFAEVI